MGAAAKLGESPVLVKLRRDGNKASVKLGFSENALLVDRTGPRGRRGVVLALSGCTCFADRGERSSYDAPLWANEGQPLAVQVVFEVVKTIFTGVPDYETTVFVQFLSDSEPVLETRARMTGEELKTRLTQARSRGRLEERGRFLRPVLDYWYGSAGTSGQFESLEMYIISNCEIPDIADAAREKRLWGFHVAKRLFLGPLDSARSWIGSREEDLLQRLDIDRSGLLTHESIDRLAGAFGRLPFSLRCVKIDFGAHCPTQWREQGERWSLAEESALEKPGSCRHMLVFRPSGASEAVAVEASFCLPAGVNHVALEVEYAAADESRDGGSGSVQSQTVRLLSLGFAEEPVVWQAAAPGGGMLEPGEQARLQGKDWCASCAAQGRPAHHMACRQRRTESRHTLALATLDSEWRSRGCPSGIFAIEPVVGMWRFHHSNLRFQENSVMLCSGKLVVVDGGGVPRPPAPLADGGEFLDGRKQWLVFRV